jgi:hypothetical protein
MAEIGQIEMINFQHNRKVKKKLETLLQTDLRLNPSSQSAVVVLIMTESLGGDPVHG